MWSWALSYQCYDTGCSMLSRQQIITTKKSVRCYVLRLVPPFFSYVQS